MYKLLCCTLLIGSLFISSALSNDGDDRSADEFDFQPADWSHRIRKRDKPGFGLEKLLNFGGGDSSKHRRGSTKAGKSGQGRSLSGSGSGGGLRHTRTQKITQKSTGGISSSKIYRYRVRTKDGKTKYRVVNGGYIARPRYEGYWYQDESGKLVYHRQLADEGGSNPSKKQQYFRIVYKTPSGEYYSVVRKGFGIIAKNSGLLKPIDYYQRYRDYKGDHYYRRWKAPLNIDGKFESARKDEMNDTDFVNKYLNIDPYDWDTWNKEANGLFQKVGADGEVFVVGKDRAILIEGDGGVESSISGLPPSKTRPTQMYPLKAKMGETIESVNVQEFQDSEPVDETNGAELVGIEEIIENPDAKPIDADTETSSGISESKTTCDNTAGVVDSDDTELEGIDDPIASGDKLSSNSDSETLEENEDEPYVRITRKPKKFSTDKMNPRGLETDSPTRTDETSGTNDTVVTNKTTTNDDGDTETVITTTTTIDEDGNSTTTESKDDKPSSTNEDYRREWKAQNKLYGKPKEFPDAKSAKRSNHRVVIIKRIVYYRTPSGRFKKVDNVTPEDAQREPATMSGFKGPSGTSESGGSEETTTSEDQPTKPGTVSGGTKFKPPKSGKPGTSKKDKPRHVRDDDDEEPEGDTEITKTLIPPGTILDVLRPNKKSPGGTKWEKPKNGRKDTMKAKSFETTETETDDTDSPDETPRRNDTVLTNKTTTDDDGDTETVITTTTVIDEDGNSTTTESKNVKPRSTAEEYRKEWQTQNKLYGKPQEFPDVESAKRSKHRVVIIKRIVYYRTPSGNFKKVDNVTPEDAQREPAIVSGNEGITPRTEDSSEEYHEVKNTHWKDHGEPKEYDDLAKAQESNDRVVIVKKIVYYRPDDSGPFKEAPESPDEAKKETSDENSDNEDYHTQKAAQYEKFGEPREFTDFEEAKKSKHRVVIIKNIVYYINSKTGQLTPSSETTTEAQTRDEPTDGNESEYWKEKNTQWTTYGQPKEYPDLETARKSNHRVVIVNKTVYYRSSKTGKFHRGFETVSKALRKGGEQDAEYRKQKITQWKMYGPPQEFSDFESAKKSKHRVVIIKRVVYYRSSPSGEFVKSSESPENAQTESDDVIEDGNDAEYREQRAMQWKQFGQPQEYWDFKAARDSNHRVVIIRRIVYYRSSKTDKFMRSKESSNQAIVRDGRSKTSRFQGSNTGSTNEDLITSVVGAVTGGKKGSDFSGFGDKSGFAEEFSKLGKGQKDDDDGDNGGRSAWGKSTKGRKDRTDDDGGESSDAGGKTAWGKSTKPRKDRTNDDNGGTGGKSAKDKTTKRPKNLDGEGQGSD